MINRVHINVEFGRKKNNKAPQSLSELGVKDSDYITILKNLLRKCQKTNESIEAEAKKNREHVAFLRSAHERELNSLHAYIEDIQVKRQELESKNLNLKEESLRLQQINKELRDKNELLRGKAERRKRGIDKLQKEIKDLNREIDELTKEVNVLEDKNRKQMHRILELKPKKPSVKRKRSITDAYEQRKRTGVNVDRFKQLRI